MSLKKKKKNRLTRTECAGPEIYCLSILTYQSVNQGGDNITICSTLAYNLNNTQIATMD